MTLLTNLITDLTTGCEQLELTLASDQYQLLINYLNLLIKWNKAYNLTAISNPKDIIIKHLLDSLAIVKYINNDINNLIDIGTGAGLPGLVIAIARPNLKVTLLDSNNKKTSFLQQVKINLKLVNLTIVHSRAEDYVPDERFDAIISRAFASLIDYTAVVKHLIKSTGVIYAMKGKIPEDEIIAFNLGFNKIDNDFYIDTEKINKIIVPFLAEDRCLIKIVKR